MSRMAVRGRAIATSLTRSDSHVRARLSLTYPPIPQRHTLQAGAPKAPEQVLHYSGTAASLPPERVLHLDRNGCSITSGGRSWSTTRSPGRITWLRTALRHSTQHSPARYRALISTKDEMKQAAHHNQRGPHGKQGEKDAPGEHGPGRRLAACLGRACSVLTARPSNPHV